MNYYEIFVKTTAAGNQYTYPVVEDRVGVNIAGVTATPTQFPQDRLNAVIDRVMMYGWVEEVITRRARS